MIKVLRVITTMNPKSGGPCQGIRNSIPNMGIYGISNEVVCLDEPDLDYLVDDNFRIYKLGNGKTGYQYHPHLIDWLLQNLENYTHVIVHGIWQFHNYAVYRAIKKLKLNDKPTPQIAIMPHGMLDPYFQKANKRRFKSIRNKIVWQITEKHAINNCDALFFTCEEELNLAKTTFKGYLPKLEIDVGYGIQRPPGSKSDFSKKFYNKVPELKNNYWLFLSRIHPKKGLDLLIDSYLRIEKKNPLIPDLVIAGPINSNFAKEMISLAAQSEKIHFPGMLKGDEKWGAFYNCEAFILPSYQENFGIAIVEAMACGKPVIISKNINIWKEINNYKAGSILSALNSRVIDKALLDFHNLSSSQKNEIGNFSRNCFDDKFHSERTVINLISALKLI